MKFAVQQRYLVFIKDRYIGISLECLQKSTRKSRCSDWRVDDKLSLHLCKTVCIFLESKVESKEYEPLHVISNNVLCATGKASDQLAHTALT